MIGLSYRKWDTAEKVIKSVSSPGEANHLHTVKIRNVIVNLFKVFSVSYQCWQSTRHALLQTGEFYACRATFKFWYLKIRFMLKIVACRYVMPFDFVCSSALKTEVAYPPKRWHLSMWLHRLTHLTVVNFHSRLTLSRKKNNTHVMTKNSHITNGQYLCPWILRFLCKYFMNN